MSSTTAQPAEPASSSSGDSSGKPTVRQWNDEFQLILETITDETILDEESKFRSLCNLARDFVTVATRVGRTIIAEKHLPVAQKTIKPMGGMGIAGGVKYCHEGIFFKWAMDDKGLYGSHEFAAKVAGLDLLGLTQLWQCEEEGLSFPLMCLIDFRGWRLSALSVLPLSKDSLVWGSDDGGRTILNKDPVVNNKMVSVARKLNLAKQQFTDAAGNSTTLYGPFDFEVHRGLDDRYYCLDFARLFPSEPPKFSAGSGIKNSALFRLFRPELVRKEPRPLNPDAFLTLGGVDRQQIKDIKSAHARLLNEVIPSFAAFLDSQPLYGDVHRNLSSHAHHFGVNVRYYGYVRRLVKVEEFKHLLLVETVYRRLKGRFRAAFRALSDYLAQHGDAASTADDVNKMFIGTALAFLNQYFGLHAENDQEASPTDPPLTVLKGTKTLWTEVADEINRVHFATALSQDEQDDLRGVLLKTMLPLPPKGSMTEEDFHVADSTPRGAADTDSFKPSLGRTASTQSTASSTSSGTSASARSKRKNRRKKRSELSSGTKSLASVMDAGDSKADDAAADEEEEADEMVDAPLLLHVLFCLCDAVGIELDVDFRAELVADGAAKFDLPTPLALPNLTDLTVRVKQLPIVNYSDGTARLIYCVKQMRRLGKRANLDQEIAAARKSFDLALAFSLDNPSVLSNYSFLLQAVCGIPDASKPLLERAVEANPYHVRARYYLGILHQRYFKDNDEAEKHMLKAVEISGGNHPNALKDLANLMRMGRKKFDEAEKYYRMAIAADPGHPRALVNLATMLSTSEKTMDYEEVMELYIRGIVSAARRPNIDPAQFCNLLLRFLRLRGELFAQLALQNVQSGAKGADEEKLVESTDWSTLPRPAPVLQTPGKLLPTALADAHEKAHNHKDLQKELGPLLREADFCLRLSTVILPKSPVVQIGYADFLCYYLGDMHCAELYYRSAVEQASSFTGTKWLPVSVHALCTFLSAIRKDPDEGLRIFKEHVLKYPQFENELYFACFCWKAGFFTEAWAVFHRLFEAAPKPGFSLLSSFDEFVQAALHGDLADQQQFMKPPTYWDTEDTPDDSKDDDLESALADAVDAKAGVAPPLPPTPPDSAAAPSSSSSSSSSSSAAVQTYEGVMHKKGKIFGGWTERFYVCKGKQLQCYADASKEKLRSSLPLAGSTVELVSEKAAGRGNVFVLTPRQDRQHFLHVPSADALQLWLNVLQAQGAKLQGIPKAAATAAATVDKVTAIASASLPEVDAQPAAPTGPARRTYPVAAVREALEKVAAELRKKLNKAKKRPDVKFPRSSCIPSKKTKDIVCRANNGLSTFTCICNNKALQVASKRPHPFVKLIHKHALFVDVAENGLPEEDVAAHSPQYKRGPTNFYPLLGAVAAKNGGTVQPNTSYGADETKSSAYVGYGTVSAHGAGHSAAAPQGGVYGAFADPQDSDDRPNAYASYAIVDVDDDEAVTLGKSSTPHQAGSVYGQIALDDDEDDAEVGMTGGGAVAGGGVYGAIIDSEPEPENPSLGSYQTVHPAE